MLANNTKAMCVHAGAINTLVKPKNVKPKILKGGSCKLSQLANIATPKLGKNAYVSITKVVRLCPPVSQAKAQTQPQAVGATPTPAPKGAQAPTKAPQ
ncbi:60S ribosomal protein L29-like [Artibeus jamaicensis]|uniref:60S ribosomal protein L29-like n=1 Tax=Artibeus jamaicensis TaxID=9417 RepID=UPI00235A7833|nr:60S ribosomal protein L29-like [Artibeus jamaicensis]